MALQGLIDEGRRQELLIAAKTGCDAFMATGGERGWHQESWHYYRYALGHHFLPFACAWRHRIDRDAFAQVMLGRIVERMRTRCLGRPCCIHLCGLARTPWCRIGNGRWRRPIFTPGELAMGAGLLGPDQASALAWELVDRCGAAGDATWDIRYGHHALLALLHVPEVTLSGAEAASDLGPFLAG